MTIKTEALVAGIIKSLEEHEQILAELVVDAQDAAEEAGVFSAGFFTGDNDDIPICVPEDADPLLDGARSGIQQALDDLREWKPEKPEPEITEEQKRAAQEKNITETFGNNGQWHAELNIEYDGDDLVSWCHVSTTRKGKDYCSSLGVVDSFGTVEAMDGDCIQVPQSIERAITKWADENGY